MFSTLYPQIHRYDNPFNNLDTESLILNSLNGLELRREHSIKKSVASQTFLAATETDKIDLCIDEEYEERPSTPFLANHINGMGSGCSSLSIWDDVDVCQHCGSLLRAR